MAGDNVPPLIAAHLSYLVAHFPLTVKVEQMWSGSKVYPGSLDRFTLAIPFCLDFLKWDIVYDSESPSSAPDVIFGAEDETFLTFLLTGGEELKSYKNVLTDWHAKDPSRLMLLIQQLRDQYMSYQKKLVGEVDDDRLKFEISTILSREGIEMHLISGTDKMEEVKFAVPLLDMDINKMVPGCPWRHPQKIYLQVIFPVGKKYGSTPSAPRLKLASTSELKALFSVEDVKLPSWVNGMCMAEYLPHLEESLEKQVLEAVALTDVRRCFIEALAPLFGRPLEADPVFCRRATVLVVVGVFTFMVIRVLYIIWAKVRDWRQSFHVKKIPKPLVRWVHFFIPTQFPRQQPVLMLQSSQHFNSQGVPIKSHHMTDYPWSPRWETSTMAERIFEFLVDEAVNFKRYCNEALHQH